MGSANVEFVQSLCARCEGGDFGSAGWAHRAIEFVIAGGGPSPGSWTGLAGLAEGFRDWLSAWEGYRAEAEEYRDLGGERVLVLVRHHGRGKTSGVELGQMRAKGASLFHVGGGRVTKLVLYYDRERALADLGLDPADGSGS